MENWGYYTADGFSDYLPELCLLKRQIEERLRTLFQSSAFREVETTGLEFYDAYTRSGDFARQEELFKVQDERGRLLALRFDGTIPVARLAATVLKYEARPLRLSYIGRMYRFGEHGGGRMKEFTQAGVELLGSRSPAADAELIALAIQSMRSIGLEDIQIAVGQTDFFRTISSNWGLDDRALSELFRLIDQRNEIAVAALLDAIQVSDNDRKLVDRLISANGDWSITKSLRELIENKNAVAVLDELDEIEELLTAWDLIGYCSLDLAELSGMHYYTGMTFKGYSYDSGFPLCSGGRYDTVVGRFGEPTAATGFSLGVDLCLQTLRRQGRLPKLNTERTVVLIPKSMQKQALPLVENMRHNGTKVELYWLTDESAEAIDAIIQKLKIQEDVSEIIYFNGNETIGTTGMDVKSFEDAQDGVQ